MLSSRLIQAIADHWEQIAARAAAQTDLPRAYVRIWASNYLTGLHLWGEEGNRLLSTPQRASS